MNTCFENALPDISLHFDIVVDPEDLFLFEFDHFQIDSNEDIFTVEEENLEQTRGDFKRAVIQAKWDEKSSEGALAYTFTIQILEKFRELLAESIL